LHKARVSLRQLLLKGKKQRKHKDSNERSRPIYEPSFGDRLARAL
jgi:hypothetical protein